MSDLWWRKEMNVCVTESCSMPGGDGAPATSRQPRGKVKASTVLYCYFLLEKKQDNFFPDIFFLYPYCLTTLRQALWDATKTSLIVMVCTCIMLSMIRDMIDSKFVGRWHLNMQLHSYVFFFKARWWDHMMSKWPWNKYIKKCFVTPLLISLLL